MENVFLSSYPVDEQFDLKGSKIDRLVTVEDSAKPFVAQKDLNLTRKLHLGAKRTLILEQLEKDTNVLLLLSFCVISSLD